MKPKNEQNTLEIFKVLLKEIINKEHSVPKLSKTINWKELEERLSKKYADKMGTPGKQIRLMAGLQYLKYMFSSARWHLMTKVHIG